MPALPSPGKVLKIVFQQTMGADVDVINRVYYGYTGTPPTSSELNTMAALVAISWGVNISSQQSNDITLHTTTIEDLTSSTGAVGVDTTTHTGTGTGAICPANVALIIKEQIARRYRGGHPRIYIAGLEAANLVNAQQWSAATVSAFEAAWGSHDTAIVSAGWSTAGVLQPVNVSYYQGFTPHTYPSGRTRDVPNVRSTPLVDPIISFVVNSHVGSQRRRTLQTS